MIVLSLLLCFGCVEERQVLEGKVSFTKLDGKVTEVTILFPRTKYGDSQESEDSVDRYATVKVSSREEAEKLELQLQSMLKDLQYGIEQMPIEEKVEAPVKETEAS